MLLASCLVSLHLWEEPSFGLCVVIFRKQREASGYCFLFSTMSPMPRASGSEYPPGPPLDSLYLSVFLLEFAPVSWLVIQDADHPLPLDFRNFSKNSCLLSCMVAGSHDFAIYLTVQRIWLEGSAQGLHQLATLSPATDSCSLVSDLSLPWFVCMWCMELTAAIAGARSECPWMCPASHWSKRWHAQCVGTSVATAGCQARLAGK